MRQRVLVIALDGFEASLADSLQAQGQMPAWGRLKARSARFDLEHGWAATRTGLAGEHFSTGLDPDAARRWAAVDFDPRTYRISQQPTGRAPFTAGLEARTVVFDMAYFDLMQAPNAQGIVNWGAHDPGVPRAARPASLDGEMIARFGPYPAEEWIYGFVWQSPERTKQMSDDLVAAVELRAAAAKWLLAERLPDWDLGLVMVSEAHSGIEALWHGIDPDHRLAGLPSAAAAGEGMAAIYRAIDGLIEDLTAAFPDAAVVVSSMHGMGTNDSDPVSMVLLSELLHRESFGRPYLQDGGWAKLADGTPVLAADGDWHDEMRLLAPDSRSRLTRLRDRLAGCRETNLDWMPAARYRGFWPRMEAFALPSFYDGRIRVNLKGREARGRVALADYGAKLDQLEDLLAACVDPLTGEPAVASVERASHADPRDLTATEADLVVVWKGSGLGLAHPKLGTIGPVPYRRSGGHTGPLGVAFVAAEGGRLRGGRGRGDRRSRPAQLVRHRPHHRRAAGRAAGADQRGEPGDRSCLSRTLGLAGGRTRAQEGGAQSRARGWYVADPIKVLGLAGSLRRGSLNRALLRAAQAEAPEGMEITIFDLAEAPLYNGDVEAEGDPPAVAALKQAIGEADSVLMATPEYNHGVPAVMKNAVDWASRPPRGAVLGGKPVGIIGASPGMTGSARGQSQLRQAFEFTNSYCMPQPELLVFRAHEKFDAEGRLTDEATAAHLRRYLEAFAEWTRRLRG